jgi:LacI family transcriptional regulator
MPRPLTVIGYDLREYARTAAELLFERIHGGQTPPRTVVLPTHLPGTRAQARAAAPHPPASEPGPR